MKYVDGFVLPVPKKNLEALPPHCPEGGKDLAGAWRARLPGVHRRRPRRQDGGSIPKTVKLKPGETVVFAWIGFKSRAHRDRVNAKVMKDPRLAELMDGERNAVRRQAHGSTAASRLLSTL